MFVVGFATHEEVLELEKAGWEVEDARKFGRLVGPEANTLMTEPTPGPAGTRAVVVFVDAAVRDVLGRELEGEDIQTVGNLERHEPLPEPVCNCGTTTEGHPNFGSKSHEGYCQISLKQHGFPYLPLNVFDWATEDVAIQMEIEKLQEKRQRHRARCTHKMPGGSDVRRPCGGDETWCDTCKQQFD